MEIVFGFGRRSCPGLHLAVGNVFAQMAMLLAMVDMSSNAPEPQFTTGLVS